MRDLFFQYRYALEDIDRKRDALVRAKDKASELEKQFIDKLYAYREEQNNKDEEVIDYVFEEGEHIYKIDYNYYKINVDEGVIRSVVPFEAVELKDFKVE